MFTDKHITKLFRALENIKMISTNFSRNPKPVRTLLMISIVAVFG